VCLVGFFALFSPPPSFFFFLFPLVGGGGWGGGGGGGGGGGETSLAFMGSWIYGNGKEVFDVGALGHYSVTPPFA